MAGHIQRKEVIYMLILVGFVLGVFYFYKGQHFLNDMFRGTKGYEKTQIVHSNSSAKRSFQKNMEASLNEMLSGVFDEMSDYRKRRKILSELIKPQNLQNAQYITESYQLAQKTIPDLKSRSNQIIKIFGQKDIEVRALIKSRPPAAQKEIMQAWNNVKNKQVNLYVKYFAIEQDIIQKHQTLIEFYYQHRNEVFYTHNTNQVTFNKPELNAKATQISKEISALKQKQNALTK